jgi:hypothetical protein
MPPEKGSKSSNTRHNLSSLSVQPNPPFPTVHKTQTQQMMNINTVFFYSMKFLFMKILLIVFFYLFSHIYLSLSLSVSIPNGCRVKHACTHTYTYTCNYTVGNEACSVSDARQISPHHTHTNTHTLKDRKNKAFR